MKTLPFLFLALAACAPKVEVTLFSIAGTDDPVLSRVEFVLKAGDRSATASDQEVELPRIETITLPEGFNEEPLIIEAIAFINDREVGRSAVNLSTGQTEANLFFPLCSNAAAAEAEELCDYGNLTDADGCDSTCKPTGCNSDVFTPGEVCFSTENPVVANAAPSNVLVEDTDGDQLLDLIASYPDQGRVRIFFGNEENQFGDFFEVNVGVDARLVSVADLNQDGFFDFVATTQTTFVVFTGNGDGTFVSRQSFLAGADLKGLALVDLDGDQLPEQITLDFGQNRIRTLLGLGDGTFDLTASNTVTVDIQPLSFTVVDIDQDGDSDILTANASGSISVVLNDAGTLTAKAPISVNGTPLALTTADFDGDGLLDIAVTKQAGDGLVSVFTQRANAQPIDFQAGGTFTAPNNPKGLIAADVDLDGDIDIAVASESDSTVTILINNGSAQFAPVEAPTNTTPNPKAITAGDINRDGLVDFVTAGQDLGLIFSTP